MLAVIITVIVISAAISAVLASARKYDRSLDNKKTKALKAPLSTASKKILNFYKTLPEDSQRLEGLEASLRALDVKHSVDKVNAHFLQYEFPYIQEGKREFSWKPNSHWKGGAYCTDVRCAMSDYYEIYRGLEGIAKDWAEQQRAFEIAGVQEGLDNVAAIREKIREERGIIQETTRKYT